MNDLYARRAELYSKSPKSADELEELTQLNAALGPVFPTIAFDEAHFDPEIDAALGSFAERRHELDDDA